MFLILDRNSLYRDNGNVHVMYVNVDNIKALHTWEDLDSESIHDRWAIQFEFMNGTRLEGPRFPDINMAQQHMLYILGNAIEIGKGMARR